MSAVKVGDLKPGDCFRSPDGRGVEGGCPSSEIDGVKEGRYAIDSEADTAAGTRFYRVLDGALYVIAGPDEHKLPKAAWDSIIAAIKAQGIEESARRYGREVGECCVCGRRLTSKWRQEGIGPVCADKGF